MKKFWMLVAALCLFSCNVSLAGASTFNQEQILKELEQLKKTVQLQQQHIDQLKAIINESLDKKIEDKIENKIASKADSKVTLANTFINQLKIKGDLRVRYERRDRDNPDDNYDARNRFRTRFRLGGVWKNKEENWEVGAGVATGTNSGTSTNDTWGEESEFETGDLRLDYAYAKHSYSDFTITLGQHKNPFVKSWLFWDSDLRPTGLTVQYAHGTGVFATMGGYGVRFYSDHGNDTAMLFAGQVGYKNKFGNTAYSIAAGYQHFDGVFSSAEAPNPDYDFQIADLYAKASLPIGSFKLSPYVHIWTNFGADGNVGEGQVGSDLDPGEEDIGWVLGLDGTIGKFKLGYAYAVVEADSIFGDLKDADFGTGLSDTDIKGHRINAFYNFTKNVSSGITAMLYEANERAIDREVDLLQIDVKYKF